MPPHFGTVMQAAFLTAATQMLRGLSYVQRYSWFGLIRVLPSAFGRTHRRRD